MNREKRCAFWTTAVAAILVVGTTPTPGHAVAAWQEGAPIAAWWGGPAVTNITAQQAVSGGFNLLPVGDTSSLPVLQQYGLRAQLQSPLLSPASLSDPTKLAQLNTLIDQFKASPAAYSYYLADEPSAAQFPALAQLVNHIRQRDPNHLPYINLLPTYATSSQLGVSDYGTYLSQYVSTVQPSALSFDHYLFKTNGDYSDGATTNQYFQNLALTSQAARQAGVPFMNIVQAIAETPAWRTPNANELRFMNYATLAYGGQGMSYYHYYSQGTNTGGIQPNGDGTPSPIATTLTTLNREFVNIAFQTQKLTSSGTYVLGDQPIGTTRPPTYPAGVSGPTSPFTITIPVPVSYPPGVSGPDTIDTAVPDTTYVEGQAAKSVLLGLFGPNSQLSNANCALVANSDYTVAKTVTVTGPGDLSVYNATTGVWTSQHSHRATLNLQPGGGTLVGLTSTVSNLSSVAPVSPWPQSAKLANYISERTAGGVYSVKTDDLLQTHLGSVNAVGDFVHHPGTTGELAMRNGDFSGNMAYAGSGESLTYALDITANHSGYDLSEITTFASGDTNRYQQIYDVYVHKVGAAADAFERLASVLFMPTSIGWANSTKVVITAPDGAMLARGVDQIRFVFGDGDAGFQCYREMDVLGIASVSVPEPSVSVLLLTGVIGLLLCVGRCWL